MTMLDSREGKIEMLLKQKEELQDSLSDVKAKLLTKTNDYTRILAERNTLSEEVTRLSSIEAAQTERRAQLEVQVQQLQEEQLIMQERNADLQTRLVQRTCTCSCISAYDNQSDDNQLPTSHASCVCILPC